MQPKEGDSLPISWRRILYQKCDTDESDKVLHKVQMRRPRPAGRSFQLTDVFPRVGGRRHGEGSTGREKSEEEVHSGEGGDRASVRDESDWGRKVEDRLECPFNHPIGPSVEHRVHGFLENTTRLSDHFCQREEGRGMPGRKWPPSRDGICCCMGVSTSAAAAVDRLKG